MAPPNLLETSHAALVVSLAHQARFVIALRLLNTGAARDVSGVLRVTRGGCEDWDLEDGEEDGEDGVRNEDCRVEKREFLYYVGGDGGVRVFERGT